MHSTLDPLLEQQPTNDASIDNLYPALIRCFAIILCGYLSGRLGLISAPEGKGMATFVGTFSLPALVFMSLAQIDLSSVNWMFLISILVAKSLVFGAVIVVTLLVRMPKRFGRAGIFAIFCTQSNDFAIGYPIVIALYGKVHPEYASYIYLMAPISLAILNPIGFVLMEYERQRQIHSTPNLTYQNISSGTIDSSSANNNNNNNNNTCTRLFGGARFQLVKSVLRRIFLNPIILMTFLGVVGNFVFAHRVPCLLGDFLDVLGSAFPASAMFLLGLRMVGKMHNLGGTALIIPGILIVLKLIALPLIVRETIFVLNAGHNASVTDDLSTFGFLYGTFPSAPTVFVFATQYAIDVDMIASAMVACTFISAPLMSISAKMVTISKTDPSEYMANLDSFTFNIAIIGLCACVWLLIVFAHNRKLWRLPYTITTFIITSQVMTCLGAILWLKLNSHSNGGWSFYLPFSLFTVGVYSGRLWTAFLAVTLTFLTCRTCTYMHRLQAIFFAIGWGVPVVLNVLLICFGRTDSKPFGKINLNFVYGASQAIVSVSLLIFSFIVTVGCLILQQRFRRLEFLRNIQDGSDEALNSPQISESPGDKPENQESGIESSADLDYLEQQQNGNNLEILKHTVLLILFLCSIFVGLALSIWTLVVQDVSGIYIELSFLDLIFNFGQSLLILALFGLEVRHISAAILNRIRNFF